MFKYVFGFPFPQTKKVEVVDDAVPVAEKLTRLNLAVIEEVKFVDDHGCWRPPYPSSIVHVDKLATDDDDDTLAEEYGETLEFLAEEHGLTKEPVIAWYLIE